MATNQDSIGNHASRLIAWLAVPRVFTLPVLLAVGGFIGHAAWQYVDSVKILAWAAGVSSPFCMLCASAIWAMRDRLDEAADTEAMSAREYQAFSELVAGHRNKSTFWAGITAAMALTAAVPAISNQLIGPIWHWMVICSGGALGSSVYGYMLADHWEIQTRAFKTRQHLARLKEKEHQELITSIRIGEGTSSVGMGWKEVSGSPSTHH